MFSNTLLLFRIKVNIAEINQVTSLSNVQNSSGKLTLSYLFSSEIISKMYYGASPKSVFTQPWKSAAVSSDPAFKIFHPHSM